MAELKLNKDVAPTQEGSYIKKEEKSEERKMFANKKVNIALGIAAVVIVAIYIAAFVI